MPKKGVIMKTALITGISGQDGSYLSELLLSKEYKVFGLVRNFDNLSRLNDISYISGDITDSKSMVDALKQSNPDEIYNLAAQSFVAGSWNAPQLVTQVNAIGVINLLEAIRKVKPDTRFYQASSSEMFGQVQEIPQRETTPFNPRTPYGIAKLHAHLMVRTYRECYGIFACSGILYNHESERRGIEYVTRKITSTVAAILDSTQDHLELGNLSATRDWGHAEDYVNAMYLMLQHHTPDDYVIATGKAVSVRDFATKAFAAAGMSLRFEGEGINEVGIEIATNKIRIKVNPKFFRPLEVDLLLGDSSKAKNVLNWKHNVTFDMLVERMLKNDILQREIG